MMPPLVSARESSGPPEVFEAFIGGMMGPSFSVKWDGRHLAYTKFGPGGAKSPPERIVVPADRWPEFRAVLDGLDVWKWKAEYENPGVVDGTGWSLRITWDGRRMESGGTNNYPDARGRPNDRPEPTPTFRRFLAAVEHLAGGREFR